MKRSKSTKEAIYSIFLIIFVFLIALLFLSGSKPYVTDKNPQAIRERMTSPEFFEEESKPILIDLLVLESALTPEVDPASKLTIDTLEFISNPEPYVMKTDEDSIIALCQMVWGEDRGGTKLEQAGCVWCVLNRVDSGAYPDTILAVLKAPSQFNGYSIYNPVTDEIRELVEDVVLRWELEQLGQEDVGRVLPKDYFWFSGDGRRNYFRNGYARPFSIWDWSLPNPYIDK